jgi:hypothetical protein
MLVRFKLIFSIIFLFVGFHDISAQEQVTTLDHNPFLKDLGKKPVLKTTLINLPFFEDFTNYDAVPDQAKWVDRSVYINNTMGFQPVSRGVATFDALNSKGGPYDSTSFLALLYADSLTSQPIDMSLFTPADSVYLSFFHQPQGNGFSPETQDSLMLYLKDGNNNWNQVWRMEGKTVQPFRQVMIPIVSASYFNTGFQFRFVNKASINLNDDIWNVDYIRVGAGRNINDTAINDVATTRDPSYLLNDYTSMPYRQFTANMANELAGQHSFIVRNNYSTTVNVTYGYTAREAISNTSLFISGQSTSSIPGNSEQQFSFPVYTIGYTAPNPYSLVVLENKYYETAAVGINPKINDTIIRRQVFDNYLAYDDGTAEKSYFLKLFSTLPAKTAVEFHLNQPDTLRGIAIYFGRQVPIATGKFFSVGVYKNITVNGPTQDSIYQQDLLFPGYVDTINHFFIYKFDIPIPLAAGTFFMGTVQPASSGSDSLYFGLDVNRIGGNHLYVNFLNQWVSSTVSGALMIRPILGQPIIGMGIKDVGRKNEIDWEVYPNPSIDKLAIHIKDYQKKFSYNITDVQGRLLISGNAISGQNIDLSKLSSGIYFIRLNLNGSISSLKKMIKQ